MVTSPTIEVASLGMWDSLILMVLALVVFGPRRLPEIGRKLGRVMYEIRKASNDFKFQMEEELRNATESDRRKSEEERLRLLAAPAQTAGTVEAASQLPAAAPAAPAPGAVESPYPEEAVYPSMVAPAAEAPAEEAVLSTQPSPAAGPAQANQPDSPAAQAAEPGPAPEQARHG